MDKDKTTPVLSKTATISCFIDDLKSKWNPKCEKREGYGYHGSKSGEKFDYEVYFDNYRCEWTSKERAFQGFVFENINKFL